MGVKIVSERQGIQVRDRAEADAVTGSANPRQQASRARHQVGFWLVAAVFTLTMAFSTVPTPLYPSYERVDGFGPFVVTIVFSAYALGVLVSLFLAGHLSDWYGRKAVLLPAVVLSIASALVFLGSAALPALIVGRVLSGLSVGLLTATATAHLDDLHRRARPGASGTRASVVATGANLGGLGLGTLVSGLIVEHTSTPLKAPFLVFLVLLGAGALTVLLAPETVDRPEPRPRYRPQRVSVPEQARPSFFAAAIIALITFAMFGLFTSLAPAVLKSLHSASAAATGVTVFLVFGSAALAQILLMRWSASAQLRFGLGALAVGLVLLTSAVWVSSLALFVLGGVVSGAAAGTAFKGSVSTVLGLAAPERRGETLTGLFLAAYLGISLPVVGLGIAVQSLSIRDAMSVFAVLLLAATGVVALTTRRRGASEG